MKTQKKELTPAQRAKAGERLKKLMAERRDWEVEEREKWIESDPGRMWFGCLENVTRASEHGGHRIPITVTLSLSPIDWAFAGEIARMKGWDIDEVMTAVIGQGDSISAFADRIRLEAKAGCK